jgi:hypothetical protein
MRKLPTLVAGPLQSVGTIHVQGRRGARERTEETARERIGETLAQQVRLR